MTNFKQILDVAIERRARENFPSKFLLSYPYTTNDKLEIIPNARAGFLKGAALPSELLLLALEALAFECGNRCAIGLNPCNARDTIEQIRTRLEGVK